MKALSLGLLLCFASLELEAKELYGTEHFGNEQVNFIQGNGLFSLNGTTVHDSVNVCGYFAADKAKLSTLTVNGKADLKRCEISGKTFIKGSLIAEETQFSGGLEVASENLTLKNCSVASIRIYKVAGYEGVQMVTLEDSSVMKEIIFESGKGEVRTRGSSVEASQIHGGVKL